MTAAESAPARSFIDTNIIVYALAKDDRDRSPVARRLIEDLGAARALCTSTQVLQESFVTLTRKGAHPLSAAEALAALDRIAEFPVVTIDYAMISEAGRLSARHSLSFWDALILTAAARGQAKRVYTEDLQHGRKLMGVEIFNPFIERMR